MLLAHLTGCSLYYASDVVSPRPVIAGHSCLFSTEASPGTLGKVSPCKGSASSSASPPRAPGPADPEGAARAAAPKLGLGQRQGGRREKQAPLSPSRRGRRRAFPVVQLNRAETSLHSNSRGCQRTRAKVQALPGRAERSGRGQGGRGSRLLEPVPAPGARTARRRDAAEPPEQPRAGRGGSRFSSQNEPAGPLLWAGLSVPSVSQGEGEGVCFRVFGGSTFLVQASSLHF